MSEKTTDRRPRVVVGVDGSAAARAALDFAVREARMRDAQLVAVLAVDLPDYAWIDPYLTSSHPEDDTLRRAREKLDRILVAAGTAGLDVDAVVTAVSAPHALFDQSGEADLLVVGSRGHGGFRGLVLGSVSMQCVLHAHCPVTVVRPEAAPAEQPAHRTIEDVRADVAVGPFF